MSDFLSKIAELLSGDAEPFEMPRQPVPQMRPAQPLSTGKRLGRAIFGEDALGEFEKRQLLDRDRLAAEQEMYDAAPGLNTPIPGGNPEASTPMDAMMGLAMSGGGLPSAVGRTGGESAARRPPGGRREPGRLFGFGGRRSRREGRITQGYYDNTTPESQAVARTQAHLEALAKQAGVPFMEYLKMIKK